jgi:hypothetical protein
VNSAAYINHHHHYVIRGSSEKDEEATAGGDHGLDGGRRPDSQVGLFRRGDYLSKIKIKLKRVKEKECDFF